MDNLGKIVFTCAKPSKGTAAGGGLSAHIERQVWDAKQKRMVPFQPKSVKHPEKTILNKEYLLPSDVSRSTAIEHRIKSAGIRRKIRDDQVRCLAFLCTSDRKTMEHIIAEGRFEEFAQACIDFCKLEFGNENVVSAVAHFDETTAHLHISVVPIVDGPAPERADSKKQCEARNGKAKRAYKKQEVKSRLCAKEVFTPDNAEKWQDDIVKFLAEHGFDFQRGQHGSQAKHVNPADYNAMMEELHALDDKKTELEGEISVENEKYATIVEDVKKKEKTVKSLNTMIVNLEKKREEAIANGDAENAEIEEKIEEKKQKLAKATEELNDVLQKKNNAEKDLESAKSGVMAKIFQPVKHKRQEEEKFQSAYNKGVKDTMDTIVKATRLKFSKDPTPDDIGKQYRQNWDAKRKLTKQLSTEANSHAEEIDSKDKQIQKKDEEIADKNEELESLRENISFHMKRMNEVIDKNNNLEKRLSAVDENRVRELEQKCSSETMRADHADKRSEAQAKQINDMLNDPGIQSRWNTILKEREEEQRRQEFFDKTIGSWIADAIKAILDFIKSRSCVFSNETEKIILRGIIAQANINGLDATNPEERTTATNNLLGKIDWTGTTVFQSNLASKRTQQLCDEVSITQKIVDAVIAPAYCPTPSIGGGGSNNELTNWDGTKKYNGWGM